MCWSERVQGRSFARQLAACANRASSMSPLKQHFETFEIWMGRRSHPRPKWPTLIDIKWACSIQLPSPAHSSHLQHGAMQYEEQEALEALFRRSMVDSFYTSSFHASMGWMHTSV